MLMIMMLWMLLWIPPLTLLGWQRFSQLCLLLMLMLMLRYPTRQEFCFALHSRGEEQTGGEFHRLDWESLFDPVCAPHDQCSSSDAQEGEHH